MKCFIYLKNNGSVEFSTPIIHEWVEDNKDKFKALYDHLGDITVTGDWDDGKVQIHTIQGYDPLHAYCYLEDAGFDTKDVIKQ